MVIVVALRVLSITSTMQLRVKVEAPCSHQDTASFNIIKKEIDFSFGPLATGLLKVFRCASGKSIIGRRLKQKGLLSNQVVAAEC